CSTRSSSGRGYMCDSESDSERVSVPTRMLHLSSTVLPPVEDEQLRRCTRHFGGAHHASRRRRDRRDTYCARLGPFWRGSFRYQFAVVV
ncbi:hypothetical protein V5799_031668, partial [Amblyomma americanum]